MSAARRPPNGLLVIAGLASIAGGLCALWSQLSPLYAEQPDVWDIPSYRWMAFAFAVGLVAAGVMLIGRRSTQTAGAAALVVLVGAFASYPIRAAIFILNDPGLNGEWGSYFLLVALGLAAIGAAIAIVGLLARAHGAPAPALDTRRVGIAAGCAAAGFVAAVGFSMTPSAISGPSGTAAVPLLGPFGGSFPRSVWAQTLCVVTLVVAPLVAAFVARAAAAGVLLGLAVFLFGEFVYRYELGRAGGAPDIYRPIEGTWWFLIGAVLVVGALGARLAFVPDVERSEFVVQAGES